LVAGLVNAGVFYFPLYRGHVQTGGVDTLKYLTVGPKLTLVLIAIVMTALPVIAIAMFGNRKRQKRMVTVSIIATLSFIGAAMTQVTPFLEANAGISNDSYWIGMVLPFISIVFLVLAFLGIRKDDKLVKSLDRLR
jgi:cytochrome bd-type quinol oxidase subunit 2